ncbi:MAG: uroporphyrinogen decarboxylase family protein [Acidobacteria bacterium]|nr:uroporphyrinogen decarboxylase family protein [Acidobacteriota bacterium]
MNSRERVFNMIEGRPADRLPAMPITMMFAADLIGVRYREYASDYRALARGQMAVAELFELDYVSCISDPAREPADLGAAIEWYDDHPPANNENKALLQEKAMLARLRPPDPLGGGRMHDRVKAAALLKEKAGGHCVVEGWVEGPCAEAADLRGINTLMLDFFDDPAFVRDLFEFVVEMELRFARAQVEAGADIIGVGDAAASLVGPAVYREFVLPYEKKLVDGLHAMGTRVRLHICGKTRRLFAGMGGLGCEIVDLDWMAPMDEARGAMGAEQVLLGNIDPVAVLCNGTPEEVAAAIRECRAQAGPRYIIGAGCEVVRDTPHANMRAMLAQRSCV